MQLVVGRIGRPHGIRGEVSVDVRTDDPERRFAPGAVLETEPPDAGPLTVVRARPHAGRMLVAFAELTDRDSAESRRGPRLVAASSPGPPAEDPEEFWDHDLVGLAALATTGEHLGAVV